jgi:hypothetical protein
VVTALPRTQATSWQHPQDLIAQVPREVETKARRARDDVRFMTNETGCHTAEDAWDRGGSATRWRLTGSTRIT